MLADSDSDVSDTNDYISKKSKSELSTDGKESIFLELSEKASEYDIIVSIIQ